MRTAIARYHTASLWTWMAFGALIISGIINNFGGPVGVVDLLRLIAALLTAPAAITTARAYKAKEEAGA